MEHKINGKNYCRCDTPDENCRLSECGLPDVQCPSCRQKDVIDNLMTEVEKLNTQRDKFSSLFHEENEDNNTLRRENAELREMLSEINEWFKDECIFDGEGHYDIEQLLNK